jgi:hypothetical protein
MAASLGKPGEVFFWPWVPKSPVKSARSIRRLAAYTLRTFQYQAATFLLAQNRR